MEVFFCVDFFPVVNFFKITLCSGETFFLIKTLFLFLDAFLKVHRFNLRSLEGKSMSDFLLMFFFVYSSL